MGKAILSLLFVVLTSFYFTQTVNKVDAKGFKQGPWEKKHENSNNFEYKGQFKDNKPVGTFYYYYPSGKKKAVIVHQENTGRSVANMYYESGIDMAYGIYRNQLKDSIWTYWNSYGKLSYKETLKAGKLEGKKVIFYVPENPNDKSQIVAMTQMYVNDLQQGEEIEYFNDGTLKGKGNYDKGLRTGVFTINHSNGVVMTKENYKKGKLHGYAYGYDQSGKELGKRFYKDGKELTGKDLTKYLKYCADNKIDYNK